MRHTSFLAAILLALAASSAQTAPIKCGVETPKPDNLPTKPATTIAPPTEPIATTKPTLSPNATSAPPRDEEGSTSDEDDSDAPDADVTTEPTPLPTSKAPTTTAPISSVPATIAPTPSPAADSDVLRSTGCDKAAAIKSGTYTATINGKARQYTVRVPTSYDSSKAYRFVIAFHWLGGTMQNVAGFGGYYGLQSLAAESTIFVAPQGLNNQWPNSGGEDLAFVDEIVKTIDAGLCVNQNLRFATGFSYGGSMTHSVACSRGKDFRAVAVLSGGQFSGCSGGTTPVAYLITHGISDSTISISQARAMRDKFVKTNGCTAQTATEPAAGSGTHVKTEYQGCSSGHPVVYIPFDGGHTFSPADKGARTWAPTESWNFFKQFS